MLTSFDFLCIGKYIVFPGCVGFVMATFYLVNFPDEDIQRISLEVKLGAWKKCKSQWLDIYIYIYEFLKHIYLQTFCLYIYIDILYKYLIYLYYIYMNYMLRLFE